jgi:hypothetical protein
MIEPIGSDGADDQRQSDCRTPYVNATVRLVEQELRQLMQRRTEIARRVGMIKRTIGGLSLLFGDNLPNDLRELTRKQSKSRRRTRTHVAARRSESTLQT